jgi:glycosidase
LKGITEKIDYFKQIGANIIYLNPIYKHGGKDNGYDVTSYTEIDSTFGTIKDFDLLIKKLHENGKIKFFFNIIHYLLIFYSRYVPYNGFYT